MILLLISNQKEAWVPIKLWAHFLDYKSEIHVLTTFQNSFKAKNHTYHFLQSTLFSPQIPEIGLFHTLVLLFPSRIVSEFFQMIF